MLLLPINHTADDILINKITAYSPKNSNANRPPPNSTLNPETSSDSPSAKSKGARLVSANVEVNHKNKITISMLHIGKEFNALYQFLHIIRYAGNNKSIIILTS